MQRRQGVGGPALLEVGQGEAQVGERGRRERRGRGQAFPTGSSVVARGAGWTRVQLQLSQVDQQEEQYGGKLTEDVREPELQDN